MTSANRRGNQNRPSSKMKEDQPPFRFRSSMPNQNMFKTLDSSTLQQHQMQSSKYSNAQPRVNSFRNKGSTSNIPNKIGNQQIASQIPNLNQQYSKIDPESIDEEQTTPQQQVKQFQTPSSQQQQHLQKTPSTSSQQQDTQSQSQKQLQYTPQSSQQAMSVSMNKSPGARLLSTEKDSISTLNTSTPTQTPIPNQNKSFVQQYSESSRINRPTLSFQSIDQAYKSTERAYDIIRKSLPKLQGLVTFMSSGKMQDTSNYAYMGKIRSMRDVVGTLTRHTLLLLSDLKVAAQQNQHQQEFPEILAKVDGRLKGRYEGAWQSAQYNSIGMETFARGSTYHGEYYMGQRHGYGVCRYYNGDYYEGQWSKGIREGRGMQQCTDDSNYVGDYLKGKRHGYGIYSFSNQDQYFGEYQEDIPHGHGVYVFATGQRYEGQWYKGKKHGYSQYTVETGEQYMGEWENGKPQWIQSLEKLPKNVQDEVDGKLKKSRQAAGRAREASSLGANRADDHWREDSETQQKIRDIIKKAEQSAMDAQNSRTKAIEISELLDKQAQSMLTSLS